MKIPFEFAHSLLPHFERSVIGIFKNYGADIDADARTINIDESKVEWFRGMLIMGYVIDSYLDRQNVPSFAFGCVESDPASEAA